MKRIILFLAVSGASCLLIAGDYQVMLLGDVHFDAKKYHTAPDGRIMTKYSAAYVDMWDKQSPELLRTSAEKLNEKFPFVIQLGDIVQGIAVTQDLLNRMLVDSFLTLKKFYPDHKLLSVKGNHDVRRYMLTCVDGVMQQSALWEHQIYNDAFLPLIAKELGRKSINSNFSLSYNHDLYIFYDDFAEPQPQTSINFLKKTLAANPDARNIFFITHIPLLPCSTNKPGWLLPSYPEVTKILAQRKNVIILAGNTHQPSFMKVRVGDNTLTQLVVSSLGYLWNHGKKIEILADSKEQFYSALARRKKQTPNTSGAKKHLDSMKVEEIVIYSIDSMQGFAVLKIRDNGAVDAEMYNDTSGKPATIIKLR